MMKEKTNLSMNLSFMSFLQGMLQEKNYINLSEQTRKGKQIGIFVFLDFESDCFTNFVVITNKTSWD